MTLEHIEVIEGPDQTDLKLRNNIVNGKGKGPNCTKQKFMNDFAY